eukprot:c14841_g1_i2.p2 GENE.c14841_g1_i2~~c14841_g1_i2.p2  ORF type:complete len:310 (+),score=21.25 c14841_g1_i2:78-932(+)
MNDPAGQQRNAQESRSPSESGINEEIGRTSPDSHPVGRSPCAPTTKTDDEKLENISAVKKTFTSHNSVHQPLRKSIRPGAASPPCRAADQLPDQRSVTRANNTWTEGGNEHNSDISSSSLHHDTPASPRLGLPQPPANSNPTSKHVPTAVGDKVEFSNPDLRHGTPAGTSIAQDRPDVSRFISIPPEVGPNRISELGGGFSFLSKHAIGQPAQVKQRELEGLCARGNFQAELLQGSGSLTSAGPGESSVSCFHWLLTQRLVFREITKPRPTRKLGKGCPESTQF